MKKYTVEEMLLNKDCFMIQCRLCPFKQIPDDKTTTYKQFKDCYTVNTDKYNMKKKREKIAAILE